MLVYNSVEGQSIAPRGGEVADIHVVVTGRFHLTPQQEGILRGLSLLVVGLFDRNILDLLEQGS